MVVDLNVGGVFYSTSVSTLTSHADSRLAKLFNVGENKMAVERVFHNGKIFIDRDGILFRYVLDYLRSSQLLLPASFQEHERLRHEAEFYELPDLVKCISNVPQTADGGGLRRAVSINGIASSIGPPPRGGSQEAGCVTVGYRGTFAFGRDGAGASDVKFRKLLRILVAGRVSICKEVCILRMLVYMICKNVE